MGLGTTFGVVFDNIDLGVAMGPSIGLMVGLVLGLAFGARFSDEWRLPLWPGGPLCRQWSLKWREFTTCVEYGPANALDPAGSISSAAHYEG